MRGAIKIMLRTVIKDGKTYTNIENLFNWSKNPKSVIRKDYERLVHQIRDLGMYAPLLVTDEGEVLGGNTRLKALQDLDHKEVWVSIVKPKSEAQKLQYALSSNDMVGTYDDQQLAELLMGIDQEIELKNYHINIKDVKLNKMLAQLGPEKEEKKKEEEDLDKGYISCPSCGHIFDGRNAEAVIRTVH